MLGLFCYTGKFRECRLTDVVESAFKTSVPVLTVGPKCTLAASHDAPWRDTVSMPTGQTDGRQTVTQRFPLDAASVRSIRKTRCRHTGRNRTGPPCSVGPLTALWDRPPARSVTDVDRRQRAKQYWLIRWANNNDCTLWLSS